MNIRAVIVDDEELARRGIRALLQRAGDVEIVSECGSGEEAIKTCLSISYRLVRRSRQRTSEARERSMVPTKRRPNMRFKSSSYTLVGVVAAVLVAPLIARAETPTTQRAGTTPTVESALAAEEALAKAMRDNDADAIAGMLADDWAVISAHGDVGEGKDVFPSGIRSGVLTRTAYEISEPRVRVDGHTAVVTTKVHLAGVFRGKAFDVTERVSDIFMWQGGHWKAILTHETFIPAKQAS